MDRSSTSIDAACSANDQLMPQPGRLHRRSEAELLAEESKQILEKLPPRRGTRNSQHHHSSPMPIEGTASQLKEKDLEEHEQEGRQLSVEERREAYKKELGSWQENKAHVCVPKGGVPPNSNIIGSHVVYRRKPDGTAKSRIVRWGYKDLEKNNLRRDAPSLNLDAMRLLISLSVQRNWVVRKTDIKAAYLQAKGFKRDVFVRPPKEEANRTDLWKLLVPAYGLTESGRLWYLTSYEALTGQFGLSQSRLEPFFYYKQDADESLMLIVQVDDYLYAGSTTIVGKFEAFLKREFQIGSTESGSFSIMGANLTQGAAGELCLSARRKLDDITPLPIDAPHEGKGDRLATQEQLTDYRSAIGKLLYLGRLVCPVAAFHASHAASTCSDLHLRHLRAFNTLLKRIKRESACVRYLPAVEGTLKLEAHSDASMHNEGDVPKVREGVIIFRRNGPVVHAISWVSKLAKRVARSTSTAELLAAADSVDRMTYLNRLLDDVNQHEPTQLVLDSRSAFHLCSTLREPEEVKNKLLLASIREESHSASMASIRWTPGTSHLADALTKDNQVAARRLDEVLRDGDHEHPSASYQVTTDVQSNGVVITSDLPPRSGAEELNNQC